MSAYLLADFIAACSKPGEVVPTRGAILTARTDFGLATGTELLGFVSSGGLEQPTLISTKPWKNNPNPSTRIDVDAYAFFSGTRFGYIAFLRQPATTKWLVKSFKRNTEPDPRNLSMLEAFRKKGLIQ